MKSIIYSVLFLVMSMITASVLKGENKVPHVNIDIGRPIHDIARESGVPRFSIMKVAGLIDYSVSNFPRDVPVRFARKPLEIEIPSIYYLSITADQDRSSAKVAHSATTLIDTTKLTTPRQSLDLVGRILHQFNNKPWKRYIDETCPAVTGRSSILNVRGEVDSGQCGIDPHYRMTLEEWITLSPSGQRYTWVADGVLATYTLMCRFGQQRYSCQMQLEFEDIQTKMAIDDENTKRSRSQGDAKGWNTTARELKEEEAQRELVKQLEKNAVERGDRVIRR